MEVYYILIIGFLFLMAVSLLIVGVSNDAVNFLNSAIGSKSASYKWILGVAALGVILGAVFSNGMMEVARKGIFNPGEFAFNEIMVIFLAVMLTDILLLDFFNTVGLPTSTTVSIVFGILGAAVAVSVYKMTGSGSSLEDVGKYINIGSSIMIIVGIFLSVIIAFNAGIIVQWLVRLAFSFNIGNTSRYWSGLWGGFAITVILYFLIIKGASGSTLVSPAMLSYISTYTVRLLLISFLGWTFVFQILVLFTRINILKVTVLVGTFALAMAFAGNDLVNFIGVPLAGFESFKAFLASDTSNPGGLMMNALLEPVNTPFYFLLAAGLIMVLTLRFSKKAKSVTATTIDLSRQDEGAERFSSSLMARFIVRRSVELINLLGRIFPPFLNKWINRRFDTEKAESKREKVAFDQVRASVNLVVASILIAFGTSMKLPLSTTYVTFMVAMGTSLADGAWGRESAVYRISGVLTVVGGWFFTALSASLAAFLIASLIYFGKMPVILALIALSVFIMFRTHAFHKRRMKKEERINKLIASQALEVLNSCDNEVKNSLQKVSKILNLTYTDFLKEKHKELKKLRKESKQLVKEINQVKEDIPITIRKFKENELEVGHYYVQVVAYMKEMTNSLLHIVQPAFNHLDNNHTIDRDQSEKIKEFNEKIHEFFKMIQDLLSEKNFDGIEELVKRRDELLGMANNLMTGRIKILKKSHKGVKVSVTYIEMLSETKNLLLDVVQLVKTNVSLHKAITFGRDLEKELNIQTPVN